eukprot:UN27510
MHARSITDIADFEKHAEMLNAEHIVTVSYQSIIENHGMDPGSSTEFKVDFERWKNIFYSLEDAMQAHQTDAPYPKMLEVLCTKVRDLKGFETEGIFRISADKEKVDDLRKQLVSGDI